MTGRQVDMNFSHRSAGALPSNLEMHMQSILGTPPRQQQQQNQSYGGLPNATDFDNSLSQQYKQQTRVPRDRDGDDRRQFTGSAAAGGASSSLWSNKQSANTPRVGGSDLWSGSGSQSGSFDNTGIIRGQSQGIPSLLNTNIGSTSSQQQQQVLMAMQQGTAGAGGLLGMVPSPYNLQPQHPMQLVVGNLPGLNANAFGQQILAARPQFGQGSNVMMGLMNQQQQQQPKSLFDESILEGGGGRFSQRPTLIQRRSPVRSSIRRSDYSSSSKTTSRGSTHHTSATSSGNRKRVIRDRHGPADEADRKRKRSSISASRDKSRHDKSKKKDDVKDDKSKKKDDGETKSDDKKKSVEKSADDKSDDKSEKEKKSKFDEIPNTFLICKICQKVMSDGTSFENHLNGRAHSAHVKILEGRFEERAHLLKLESKSAEEGLAVEVQRQRRAGMASNSGKGSKNFCTMCDTNFTINWGSHKVSMTHRVLKEYLHPTCRCCDINFVYRMDWFNHLYSLSHLRTLAELKESGVDVTEHESHLQDELFVINLEIEKDEHPTPVLLIRSTDYKTPTKDDLKEMLMDDKGEITLPEGEIDIPKEFVEDQVQGDEAIMSVEGACCKVCRVFIANRSDVETHLKTKKHFEMYVSYLKNVVQYREKVKVEAEKKKKKKEAKEEEDAARKKEEAKITQEEEEEEILMESEENVIADTSMEDDEADIKQDEEDALLDSTEETEEAEATSTPADDEVEREDNDSIVIVETDDSPADTTENGTENVEEATSVPVDTGDVSEKVESVAAETEEKEDGGGDEEEEVTEIEETSAPYAIIEPEVVTPNPTTPVKQTTVKESPLSPSITKPTSQQQQRSRGAGSQQTVRGRGRGGRGGAQQQQQQKEQKPSTQGGVAVRGILKNSKTPGRGSGRVAK